MAAHLAVAPQPAALFEAVVWRALRKVERVAGFLLAHDAQPLRMEQGGLRFRVARFSEDPGAEHPVVTLQTLVGNWQLFWRGVRWPDPQRTSLSFSWPGLADAKSNGPGVSIGGCFHPEDWKAVLSGLRLWGPFAGFAVQERVRRGAAPDPGLVRFEVDLVAVRPIEWLPTGADVARLLEACVRAEGGPPCEVTLVLEGQRLAQQRWWDDVLPHMRRERAERRQARLPGPQIEIVVEPLGGSEVAEAAVGEEQLRETVAVLQRAQRTAPRGYVGLKYFRDKLLLPGAPAERRRALFDAAVEAAVIRIGSTVDPTTGAAVATVEPNPEHPRVAEALRAANGALPDLVDLPGEPLSATVVAMREAER